MNLRLREKSILLVAVPIIGQTLVIALLFILLNPYEQELRSVASEYSTRLALEGLSNDVMLLRSHLDSNVLPASAFTPDFIAQIMDEQTRWMQGTFEQRKEVEERDLKRSNEKAAMNPLQIAQLDMKEFDYWKRSTLGHLADLHNAAKDDPKTLEVTDWTAHELNEFFRDLDLALQRARAGNAKEALAPTREAHHKIALINRHVSKLMAEKRGSVQSDKHEAELDQTIPNRFAEIVGIGFAANLLVGIALIWFLARGTISRFRYLCENIRLIALELPMREPLKGRDEFAAIDASFHSMADSVQTLLRRRRAVIENATEMIFVLNDDLVIDSTNPACEKVVGYESERLVGKSLLSLVPEGENAHYQEAFQKIRETDLKAPFEGTILSAAGAPTPVLWSVRSAPAEKKFYCVTRDISSLKALEHRKQQFVDMISDDFRRPLATIDDTFTALIEGKWGSLNEDGVDAAVRSKRNNERLLELVDDLLHLDELSSGNLDLHLETHSASDLAQKALDAVSGYASKMKLVLKNDAAPVEVVADGDRVVQILVNLLGNACKFSPAGKEVICSARSIEGFCEFSVKDHGRGIPKAFCKSVFERFKQVTRADATEKGGSGLGLAICKNIVESHGGTIGVESEEGKGSTFWFRLPLRPTP